MSETWENTYSGTARKSGGDWTAYVCEQFEAILPRPVISPACKRDGHDWSDSVSYFEGTDVRGCKRCMKRGLLVLQTDSTLSRRDLERMLRGMVADAEIAERRAKAARQQVGKVSAQLEATAT